MSHIGRSVHRRVSSVDGRRLRLPFCFSALFDVREMVLVPPIFLQCTTSKNNVEGNPRKRVSKTKQNKIEKRNEKCELKTKI